MGKKIWLTVYDYLFIVLGNLSFALGVVGFLQPVNISPGGLTGIAAIFNYLFSLPTGAMLFLLNLPLLIVGFIKLGGRTIFRTMISTVLSSVSIDVMTVFIKPISDDKIICALAAGVLMGAGMAMMFLHGATSGGTDIGAKLLRLRYPHVPMGRLILILDAVILAAAALVYRNLESALYSVLSILVSTTVIDKMMYGSGGGKVAFVITEKPDELKFQIYNTLKRGVTEIPISGGYSGEHGIMLMCALRRQQTANFHRTVKETDPKAFVIMADAGEVLGNGFNPAP